MAQAVLRDDDGAVDDQAEVQRAQAHEVGADPSLQHAGGGNQHGHRDHAGGDDGGAQVAQQQEQHGDDEQRAFGQVARHRMDGRIDQLRPVQHGMRVDARRQGTADLLDPGVGGRRDRAAVAADQHQRGSEHDLAPVDAGAAGAQFAPDRDIGHVLDADGNAAAGGHDDVGDVVHVLDAAGGADDVAFAVLLDVVGAAADVVGFDGGDHLTERQAVADQLRRIGLDLELLDEAADGVGAGDARHRLHLRADDPVLHGAQVHGALEIVGQTFAFRRQIPAVGLPSRLAVAHRRGGAGLFVFDGPPVDLAEPGRNRPHPDVDARRKAGLGVVDPLRHQLPREVDVGAVGEHRRDLREAVPRKRPRRFQSRYSRERGLQRDGDLLLDLDRRKRRRDGVDLHLDVGHVRNGVDRELRQRPETGRGGDERDEQDEPPAPYRKVDDPLDHRSVLFAGLRQFRLQRERVRHRDGLAGREARDDLDGLAVALAQDDVALLETVLGADEHGLAAPDGLDGAEGRDDGGRDAPRSRSPR